ncbi:hypothetical protein ACFQY0_21040 [Haloferula chungangensis]|uniref:Uncharacterized protein n=1 Tax=Haloferula chungangensis TaxID=1048331 RepID=A0ABW2LCY8_9BACT
MMQLENHQAQQAEDGDPSQRPCYVSVLVIQSGNENRRAAMRAGIAISQTFDKEMRPCLHSASQVRVITERSGSSVSIPISEYSPRFFLENTFDRMFSRQEMLLMERREEVLYRATIGDHSLAGSDDLLVAGLYGGRSALSVIPKPFITISVNLSDMSSRRRIRVQLHFDDEESIADLGLKTLFPKQHRLLSGRSKSYYFIWEVEEFLSKVAERTDSIPIIQGVDHVWVTDSAREGTSLDSFEFVPVVPLAPLLGKSDGTTLKFIVRAGSSFGSPTLCRVDSIQHEKAVFDFYFPESQAQLPYSKSPSRSCFTANGFLVFHEIPGSNAYEFAQISREQQEIEQVGHGDGE